ncbi:MAG: type II toxin-antitoxin system HicA family toxin [Chloroflexi bacterium]|nr:type II toxin-antitoxin system HicA family toxin [Chloroflexota bacterium]
MVKRVDLLDEISLAAKRQGIDFVLRRHGGDHDIFDLGGMPIVVPRHREIGPRTAASIRTQWAAKLGRSPWR